MKQKRLFEAEKELTKADTPEPIRVRPGRVGPIGFGATEASYRLVVETLQTLTASTADTAETNDG